ncbi:protein of unknown function [Xenorhabdus doucetiae]|uniref:Uncharacterized protein n=1 Tax=Xenorhabdus doucetiae TaxID=351671 RepID=A0A068QTG1_9GAMM|nr:protein of unknown function [Xenorhabdus doucetiae]
MDGEKVYYTDGEPCDISEGCRLDVRVQMPADSVWNFRHKKTNPNRLVFLGNFGRHDRI